jgi:hypothetical protein
MSRNGVFRPLVRNYKKICEIVYIFRVREGKNTFRPGPTSVPNFWYSAMVPLLM